MKQKIYFHNTQMVQGPSEVVDPITEEGPYEKRGVVGHSSMEGKQFGGKYYEETIFLEVSKGGRA